MHPEFERVAIVNRGEAAMRFINAVREFNQERGTRIRTVALYTDPDRRAMFVREADEAVSLGPATVVDGADGERKVELPRLRAPRGGPRRVEGRRGLDGLGLRLRARRVRGALRAARHRLHRPAARGDAAAERQDQRQEARRGGARPGRPVERPRRAERGRGGARGGGRARLPGPRQGGGGRRRARHPRSSRAPRRCPRPSRARGTRRSAPSATRPSSSRSSSRGVRHVEVQVLGDAHGTTWAVGVRDCTIQRRHQKVLEESPAPTLSAEVDRDLRAAALRIATDRRLPERRDRRVPLRPEERDVRVPRGERAPAGRAHRHRGDDRPRPREAPDPRRARRAARRASPPAPSGHAIEVRLNAEDPDAGFAPAPGTFVHFRLPTGPGPADRPRRDGGRRRRRRVRLDDREGHRARGRPRRGARAPAARPLGERRRPRRRHDEQGVPPRAPRPARGAERAGRHGLARAVGGRRASTGPARTPASRSSRRPSRPTTHELRLEEEQFYESAARMRPEIRREVGRTIEFRHRGQNYKLKVFRLGHHDYRVELDGARLRGARRAPLALRALARRGRDALPDPLRRPGPRLPRRGRRRPAPLLARRPRHPPRAVARRRRVGRRRGRGDGVEKGQRIATLEAMKMEMPIPAPFDGTRAERLRRPERPGRPRDALSSRSTRPPRAEERKAAKRIALPKGRAPRRRRGAGARRSAPSTRSTASSSASTSTRPTRGGWRATTPRRRPASAADEASLEAEERILAPSPTSRLSSGGRRASEDPDALGTVSTGEYLLTYLRTYDTQTPDLPARFVDRLARAASHYGVEGTKKSTALREALLWIWKSRQRAEHQVEPVLAILERRLAAAEAGDASASPALRSLLDRLVAVAESRWPALGDVARDLRYRVFDQPAFEAARRDGLRRDGRGPRAARRRARRAGARRTGPAARRLPAAAPEPLPRPLRGGAAPRRGPDARGPDEALLPLPSSRELPLRLLRRPGGRGRRVRVRGSPAPRRLDLVPRRRPRERRCATSRPTSPRPPPSTTSSSTSTRGVPGLSATPTRRRRRVEGRRRPASAFGPRVVRVVVALAGRAPASAWEACSTSRSGPARAGSPRTSSTGACTR